MPAGKILLAEDDANLRGTLAEALRLEGYEILEAANGQAAMDALDNPDAAQLIILDYLLPKVNGFDVAKFVRSRGMDTPIIFMSGVFKGQEQQKEAKEKLGAKAYLTKPFEPKRLVDAVKPLMFAQGSGGGGGAAVAGGGGGATPLPGEGQLVENPPLYLLWRAAREMHTGALELFGEKERARVFIFKGRAVLCQHSDPQLNVGIELVRDGVLDADSYKIGVEMALSRSTGLSEIFKQEGWATDAQLKAGYKVLIPKVLERVVGMSGRFRFVAGEAWTNLIPASSSPIIEPLLAGLRKIGERELDPHVSPRRPLRLAPGDAWSDVAPRLIEGCGSDSLTRAINGRATIAMMLEASGSAAERSARFRQVYLLMSTMAVKASLEVIPMAAAAAAAVQAAAPAPQPLSAGGNGARESSGASGPSGAQRPMTAGSAVAAASKAPIRPNIDENADQGKIFAPEETEARGKISAKFDEIVGKDYFTILGVKKGAGGADIKKAYFDLARVFHTDVFAGMNLGTAQKKLDHVFQTIQTAYATLSDDKKRGEYEAKMQFEAEGASSDLELIFQAESDMNRAKQLVDRGEIAAAIKLIEKALPVRPKDDEWLGYYKYCNWWQSKNPTTAPALIKELEVHFKAQPGALALKEFQGWIAIEINDNRTAKIAFNKVLEMDPKHAGATRGMRSLTRKIEEEQKKGSGLGKFLKR